MSWKRILPLIKTMFPIFCFQFLFFNLGYYIKTCEREGAEDKCLKCPQGSHNPFNSSSFDIKKCYRKNCDIGK